MIKFDGLGAMLEWKYGCIASTKQIGNKFHITAWRHVTISQPDEAQLAIDMQEYSDYLVSITYKEKRKNEYPEIGDQLDAIIDTIKFIKSEGVNIGSAGKELIDQIDAVKNKHPKP